jgi:P-type Ca2+ transporter type 2C
VLKRGSLDRYSEYLIWKPLLQGAVETLLERSTHIQLKDGSVVPLDEKSRNSILASLQEMSTKALRCLGFAYKEDMSDFATYDGENHPAHKLLLDPANYAAIETDLVFAGLVGLRVRLSPPTLRPVSLLFFNNCSLFF